jgi:hypothetical protein
MHLPSGCVCSVDQFDKLLAVTLIPASIVGILFAAHSVLQLPFVGTADTRLTWQRRCISLTLGVMFLVHTAVSTEIVKSMRCLSFDDGSTYLAADLRMDCRSPRFKGMLSYALVMLLVFPVGACLFVAWGGITLTS